MFGPVILGLIMFKCFQETFYSCILLLFLFFWFTDISEKSELKTFFESNCSQIYFIFYENFITLESNLKQKGEDRGTHPRLQIFPWHQNNDNLLNKYLKGPLALATIELSQSDEFQVPLNQSVVHYIRNISHVMQSLQASRQNINESCSVQVTHWKCVLFKPPQ